MRRIIAYLVSLMTLFPFFLSFGKTDSTTTIFRFYEDNDFLNIRGNGTDKAYTNGLRLDLYYKGKKGKENFLDKIYPKAGSGSINIYGWSLMQMMITPSNLTIPTYQKDDYPYSGALFAIHSLASYNPSKKWMLQTDLVLGIRGSASFAKQTQIWIHSLINDEKPMGWQNQCDTKVLLNVNFTAEKLLFSAGNYLEMIGGTVISTGTMSNAATIYPLMRFGLMNPYFNGLFSQFGKRFAHGKEKKMQVYLIAKPKITFLATNAVMYGEIQKSKSALEGVEDNYTNQVNHYLAELDFGLVLSRGNFSISYTQKPTTAYNKGLYCHNVGNVSLYFSW